MHHVLRGSLVLWQLQQYRVWHDGSSHVGKMATDIMTSTSLGFFVVGNSKTGQTHQSCKFVQGQDHVSLDPTTVLIKSGCTCCLSNYCPVLNPRWLRMGYRNTIAIHQRHEHLAFSFFLATLYVTVFYLSPSITKPTLFFCKQHLCAGYLCFQFLLWHIAFCAATAIVLPMD